MVAELAVCVDALHPGRNDGTAGIALQHQAQGLGTRRFFGRVRVRRHHHVAVDIAEIAWLSHASHSVYAGVHPLAHTGNNRPGDVHYRALAHINYRHYHDITNGRIRHHFHRWCRQ